MSAAAGISPRRRGLHITEAVIIGVVTVVLVGVDLMFYFWPFRYREVHPLLQQVFQSRVDVKRYHRTYFPHPGFVAEDVTFYRHGDTRIPPLATVKKMTVAGQWLVLIFHPHTLYQIRLDGLHVQIAPPGTKARRMDFDNGSSALQTRSCGSKASLRTERAWIFCGMEERRPCTSSSGRSPFTTWRTNIRWNSPLG